MEDTLLLTQSPPGRMEPASRPPSVDLPLSVQAALAAGGDGGDTAPARRHGAAELTELRGAERHTGSGLPREGVLTTRRACPVGSRGPVGRAAGARAPRGGAATSAAPAR